MGKVNFQLRPELAGLNRKFLIERVEQWLASLIIIFDLFYYSHFTLSTLSLSSTVMMIMIIMIVIII